MAHGAEAAAQLALGSIIVANDDEEMLRTRGTGRDSGASYRRDADGFAAFSPLILIGIFIAEFLATRSKTATDGSRAC